MKTNLKLLAAVIVCFTTTVVFAAPTSLIVVNGINAQSNAAIQGQLSTMPIAANSIWSDSWEDVVTVCKHPSEMKIADLCAVEVYTETDTAAPVDVGTVIMELNTGHLAAENKSDSGYQIKVLGLGRIMLTYAN